MRNVISIILLASLSGCAQYQAQQLVQAAQMDSLAVNAICQNTVADKRLDPTRGQIPDRPTQATVTQMADTTYPTVAQHEAIAHRYDYFQPCYQANESHLMQYAPAALPIYRQGIQAGKALTAQLLAHQITFGQYNTERAKLITDTMAAMRQAEQNSLAQAQELQFERQRAAAAILQAQQYRQPYIPQVQFTPMEIPQPVHTTCYRMGQYVNCTTQ